MDYGIKMASIKATEWNILSFDSNINIGNVFVDKLFEDFLSFSWSSCNVGCDSIGNPWWWKDITILSALRFGFWVLLHEKKRCAKNLISVFQMEYQLVKFN